MLTVNQNSPQMTPEYSFHNKAHWVFLPQPSPAGINVTQAPSQGGNVFTRVFEPVRYMSVTQVGAADGARYSHSGTDGVKDLCL